MSGDAQLLSNLRALLARVDVSSQAIQGTAAAIMKLYDKSASLAVNEWWNQVQHCQPDQYLALLYVVNEVLQTSKRNRGPKFLESFSPILGPSLQYMCDREKSIVEKVRRTIKIWGDRQIFSVRFVADLLHRLDQYREGRRMSGTDQTANQNKSHTIPTPTLTVSSSMSSSRAVQGVTGGQREEDKNSGRVSSQGNNESEENFMFQQEENENDEMDEEYNSTQRSQEDHDDITSPFQTSRPSLLNVDNLVIDQATVLEATQKSKSAAVATFGMKRRRAQEATRIAASRATGSSYLSNTTTTIASPIGSDGGTSKRHKLGTDLNSIHQNDIEMDMDIHSSSLMRHDIKISPGEKMISRRRSVLTATGMIDLLNHISNLNRQYNTVQEITSSLVTAKLLPSHDNDPNYHDDVVEVGDELVELNQQVVKAIQTVTGQKKILFSIVEQKRVVDEEVRKYIPFLKNALQADDREIQFCDALEKKLKIIQIVHADAKKLRNLKREEEAKKKAMEEEAARKAAEEEERKQALEKSMQSIVRGKPGMVWNSLTREYQDMPDGTQEHWRD